MFDITSDLITSNKEMLDHFRKASETFYHNRNVYVGIAAAGGSTALGVWYWWGAAVKPAVVMIPGVVCGVGIVAAGYNHLEASSAEKEWNKLRRGAFHSNELKI
jgi:hypothetical protein